MAVKGLIHFFFSGNNDMQPGLGMKVHRSLSVSGVSNLHDLVAVLPVLVLSKVSFFMRTGWLCRGNSSCGGFI